MQPEQQQRILGYFLEEARDHLNTIEQGLLNLQGTLNDPEMINEVFRAAHSIKGGAAMLGLSSIQHTSHRLEDCFKILKERPVQIDQKLESLFLGVADTLKSLLDHLGSPFGLSEDAAKNLMSETEPVFEWLNEHLELLVQQGSNGVAQTHVQPAYAEVGSSTQTSTISYQTTSYPQPRTNSQQLTSPGKSKSWAEFQNQVLKTLRDMLQIFKQSATTLSRQNLQQCCDKLVNLGKEYNLSNWCDLCQETASVIINPQNTYPTLAKVVITEIKRAQELVIQGRELEITISQELRSLEVSQETTSSFDMLAVQPDQHVDAVTVPQKTEKTPPVRQSQPAVTKDSAAIKSPVSKADVVPTLTANSLFNREDATIVSSNLDPHGPEVGIAELNTLADLFEGQSPELDEPWQQEEVIETPTTSSETGSSNYDIENADEDLAELLSFDSNQIKQPSSVAPQATEDFNLLFGDGFSEQETLESQIPLTVVSQELQQSESKSTPEITEEDDAEIAELLSLGVDEEEIPSPRGELGQQEVETVTFANLEIFSVPEENFADLLLDSDLEPVHIEPLAEDTISFDNLFGDIIEDIIPQATSELEVEDIFVAVSPAESASTNDNDELDNFWDQADTLPPEGEYLLIAQNEQNIGQALEESLLASASAEEELIETQQSIPTTLIDFEDFDLNFQQQEEHLDLILSSAELHADDLFADFTDSQSPPISTSHNAPLLEELDGLDPQLEALDFFPELINQPLEEPTPTPAVAQPDINTDGVDFDLFDGLEDSSNENRLFPDELFADENLVEDTTYIQADITVAETPTITDDINYDLFGTEDALGLHLDSQLDSQLASDILLDTFDIPEIDDLVPTPEVSFNDYLSLEEEFVPESSVREEELFASVDSLDNNNLASVEQSTETSVIAGIEITLANDFEDLDLIEELGSPDLAAAPVEESTEFTPVYLSSDELEKHLSKVGDEPLDSTFAELEMFLDDIDLEVVEDSNLIVELGADWQLATQNLVVESTEDEASIASISDGFGELEALLEISPHDLIADIDFDDLEQLLIIDSDQASELPQVAIAYENTHLATADQQGHEFRDFQDILEKANQTMSNPPVGAIRPSTVKSLRGNTRNVAIEETMKVPVKQLDEMSNLVGELVVNRNTLEQDHERLRQSLDNLLIQVQHLSDVGARMQELYERSLLEASLLASRRSRDNGSSSVRYAQDRGFNELEMDHFTLFHTLSQETIEYIVRVRESASDIDFVTEETERVARQFRQVTTQLQEGLTKARMVPFTQAVDRLRRGVHDNAQKYNKQVRLVTEGEDTLIDKMIVDNLNDPLTHMANNAISHGIETPEVRKASGKPPEGKITIHAFHQGNQTIISVSDDGAGIDHHKVKAKALAKGLISAEQAKQMSRLEVYELLFKPGFSTADQVDELMGRGIGMDVVNKSINEIRGTITTDSVIGKGTTFTIRVPLTLSICKALCCVSDKARIAFPMDGVEDTLDIHEKDIQQDAEGQSFIQWRDTILPFKPLKDILALNRQISRSNVVYGGTRDDDMVSVIVVRSGSSMVALQIDQVLNEQEIVIKQFEGPAPKPGGVAGATVLGDGRIMPIADVLEIIDIFYGKMPQQIGGIVWPAKTTPPIPVEIPVVKIDPTVLIVDDSITVRELLSLTFTKAGYRVEQARDGQEAWDKLRSGLPCDIIFCDIEMPRCDGLALLSMIQKDNNLNQLPIAMLTSRGADKHRQMAIQLGASGYFTKPYLEEALLEAASRMLKGEKLVS